ncbi:hypothetical protein [Streptomyces sp. NPDC089919]|uniref:hypothetical protein n=1 Tax=Streptomyces sp. NPDC089919 TaxID=3155188 RepID=UPI0034130D0F
MASLRRLGTLLTVVPVTGGAVAALLACAPPSTATGHHTPVPVRHAAAVTAGTAHSGRPAVEGRGRLLDRLVTLSAEQVSLDVCLPFHPPQASLLGGLPKVSRPAAGLDTTDKAYKDLRTLCTTHEGRLNAVAARLAPVAERARPLLATPQGKRALEPVMDRVAEEFHFDAAQRAALPFAVAVATGVPVVHIG